MSTVHKIHPRCGAIDGAETTIEWGKVTCGECLTLKPKWKKALLVLVLSAMTVVGCSTAAVWGVVKAVSS